MVRKKDSAEEYLVSENPEIPAVSNPGWAYKIIASFPAFQNRNYRLYFLFLLFYGKIYYRAKGKGWKTR